MLVGQCYLSKPNGGTRAYQRLYESFGDKQAGKEPEHDSRHRKCPAQLFPVTEGLILKSVWMLGPAAALQDSVVL